MIDPQGPITKEVERIEQEVFISTLNNNLKELEDADVWKRDSANSQVELKEAKALDMQSKQIDNVLDPTAAQDAATKNYVDTTVSLPSGAIFFMVTGSCPSGTTDVTATYSDKFVRINATGGSTGGADTHTTPSHILTESELPAHTHTYDQPAQVGDTSGHNGWDGTGTDGGAASGSTGSGSGHTHSATNNVPAFVTAKCCQID